jgi:hypothetical protein
MQNSKGQYVECLVERICNSQCKVLRCIEKRQTWNMTFRCTMALAMDCGPISNKLGKETSHNYMPIIKWHHFLERSLMNEWKRSNERPFAHDMPSYQSNHPTCNGSLMYLVAFLYKPERKYDCVQQWTKLLILILHDLNLHLCMSHWMMLMLLCSHKLPNAVNIPKKIIQWSTQMTSQHDPPHAADELVLHIKWGQSSLCLLVIILIPLMIKSANNKVAPLANTAPEGLTETPTESASTELVEGMLLGKMMHWMWSSFMEPHSPRRIGNIMESWTLCVKNLSSPSQPWTWPHWLVVWSFRMYLMPCKQKEWFKQTSQ